MQDNYELTQKRDQFRVSIRRKQIEDIFHSGRTKMLLQSICEQKTKIESMLATVQDRKCWIWQKKAQLSSTPLEKWFPIFRELSLSVPKFADEYNEWLSAGIFEYLFIAFKQQCREYNISQISSYILQEMFCHIPESDEIIDKILQYQLFIIDLVELAVPLNSRVTYFELMNIIMRKKPDTRNLFIDNGLVQVLSTKLKLTTDFDSDETLVLLITASKLLRAIVKTNRSQFPNGNVTSVLVSSFEQVLYFAQKQQNLKVTLICINSLVATGRQHNYKAVFGSKMMMNKILMCFERQGDPVLRNGASRIITALLSSNDSGIGKQLIKQNNILGVLCRALKIQSNNLSFTSDCMMIVSNLVSISLEYSYIIIEHEVFSHHVIPNCHEYAKQQIYKNSIYILCTLSCYKNVKFLEQLLQNFPVLQIFIKGLTCPQRDLSTCQQIVAALLQLVRAFQGVLSLNMKTNRITDHLERFYDIQKVLHGLQQEFGSKKLHFLISALYEQMHGKVFEWK